MGVLDHERPSPSYAGFDDVPLDAPRGPAAPTRDPVGQCSRPPLELQEFEEQESSQGCCGRFKKTVCAPSTLAQKFMCAAFWIAVGSASIAVFAILFPRFVERAVQPFVRLLTQKLTKPQIGAVIFAAVVILPFTLIISVLPFVWLAGIVFNFWVAMCIVMSGSFVGMSLQYWAARYAFHDKVVRRIEKNRKGGLAVVLRAVDLVGAAKVVALLRLGPFPYHWLNYALGVCPSIKYPTMIAVSFVCELLPRSLHVFFGKSLQTLADLLRGRVTNVGVAVYNVAVLVIGIGFIVLTVIMSKRALRRVEEQERALEQQIEQEAVAAAAAQDAAEAGLPQPAGGDGSSSEQQLPGKLEQKLASKQAAAAAAGSSSRPGTPSDGDLRVLVDDSSSASAGNDLSSRQICRNSGSSSSFIGVGQLQPPADAADELQRSNSTVSSVSLGSRLSSMSSFRALLAGKRTSSFNG